MFTIFIILLSSYVSFRLTSMFQKIKVKNDIKFILDVIEGNEIYLSRKRSRFGLGVPVREEVDFEDVIEDYEEGLENDYKRNNGSPRGRENFNDDEKTTRRRSGKKTCR